MSTETNAVFKENNITPIVLSRNGVEVTLVVKPFGKKSNFAGHFYQTAEFGQIDFESKVDAGGKVVNGRALQFCGIEWIAPIVNKNIKAIAQELWEEEEYIDILNKTGQYPWDKFAEDFKDFTAGIAKRADLLAEIDDLSTSQAILSEDPRFVLNEGEEAGVEYITCLQEIQNVGRKITSLKKQVAAITAKYQLRIEKRDATKLIKENKTSVIA